MDVEGNNITSPDNNPDGNPSVWADSYDVYITGRGFRTEKSPDEIVILTDSGGLPPGECGLFPWANHAPKGNPTAKPYGRNSLCLSGRVLWRTPGQLNWALAADGYTWR